MGPNQSNEAEQSARAQDGPRFVREPAAEPHPDDLPARDAAARDADEIESRWELVSIVRAGARKLSWGFKLVLAGGALLVAAQIASVYRMLADIHPWLGIGGTVVFTALVLWLLLRPLIALSRVPVAVRPPMLPEEIHRTPKHCKVQLRYLDRYLEGLSNNPELIGQTKRIGESRQILQRLSDRFDHIDDVATLSTLLTDFEQDHILPLLVSLDRRADAVIRKEALAIGSMTALSSNGTADAFIVLWRNINMIATLGKLYYGRPGVSGTWLIVRDVTGAILLSSVLEQISDMGSNMVRRMGEGSRAIPLVGALVGPMLDGTVNGLMTLKVGYLAKERCRSFQAWDPRTTEGVVRRTWRLLNDSANFVTEELVRTVGSTLDIMRSSAGKVATTAGKVVPTPTNIKAGAEAGKETIAGISTRTVRMLKGLRKVVRPELGDGDDADPGEGQQA